MAVVILDQMQMLDQQIALARPVGEQRAHLIQRGGIDLAALGRTRALAAAAFAGAGGRAWVCSETLIFRSFFRIKTHSGPA